MFRLFLCFVTNSATFLSEEVCICSNGLALLRKHFPRTLSTVSLILPKQTGSVLLLFLQLISSIMIFVTDHERKNVFIIDDSLFDRTSCKKTELGSKVFDHTDMHFKKGFRMLTLSWSDGNTLIPVNSCLLASSKDTNIIGPVKDFDNRTLAGKRRKLAQTKAPEAMMTLLDTALSAGLNADYVLFDS